MERTHRSGDGRCSCCLVFFVFVLDVQRAFKVPFLYVESATRQLQCVEGSGNHLTSHTKQTVKPPFEMQQKEKCVKVSVSFVIEPSLSGVLLMWHLSVSFVCRVLETLRCHLIVVCVCEGKRTPTSSHRNADFDTSLSHSSASR